MATNEVLIGVKIELDKTNKDLDKLNKELLGLKKGSKEFDKLTKEVEELDKEARKLASDILKLGGSFEDVYGDVRPLTTQLGELEDVLYQLALTGQQNTDEFKQIQSEAVKMRKTIIQVDASVDNLAERGANLRGLIGIASGIAGGFAVVQGSMNALGIETEEYEEQMQSMMAVMEVLNGLEAVNTALKEKNVIFTKAEALWTSISNKSKAQSVVVTEAESVAQGVNAVATNTATTSTIALNTAMLLNPALWVVAGIMALVGALAYLVMADSEAEKSEKALAKQMEDTGKEYDREKERLENNTDATIKRTQSIIDAYELEGRSIDEIRDKKKELNDAELDGAILAENMARKAFVAQKEALEKQKALGSQGTKEALKLAQERYNVAVKEYNDSITNYQNALNKKAEFNNKIIEEDRAMLQREQELQLESNTRLAKTEEKKRQVKLNYLIQETADAKEYFGEQSIEYREALEQQKQYSTEFQNWKKQQLEKEKLSQIDFQTQLNLIGVENIDEQYIIESNALQEKLMMYKEGSEGYKDIKKQEEILDKNKTINKEKIAKQNAENEIEDIRRKANISAETDDEIIKNEREALVKKKALYKEGTEAYKNAQLEIEEFDKQQKQQKQDEEAEELQSKKEALLEIGQQLSDANFSQMQENTQRRLDAETKMLEKQTNTDLAIIDDKLARGIISEEQAEREKLKIQEDAEKKQEKIEREAFNRGKVQDIAQAIINGALAITKVTAQTGVVAPLAIPSIVASTAIQVGTISAQKFADGGVIEGASHAEGGVPILGGRAEVEGGEAIINKKSTAMFKEELSLINQAGGGVKFAEGGVLGDSNIQQESNGLSGLSSRLDALIELNSMPVRAVVSETEITDSQSRINNIEERSSF